jgi:hypothetical protein
VPHCRLGCVHTLAHPRGRAKNDTGRDETGCRDLSAPAVAWARKHERAGGGGEWISTVGGTGYRFEQHPSRR